MKLFFTHTKERLKSWEGKPFVDNVIKNLRSNKDARYSIVGCSEEADIILYVEPNYYKTEKYVSLLLAEKNLIKYPNKCFVLNYDDAPIYALPGVYVTFWEGAPRTHCRSGFYLNHPNNMVLRYLCKNHITPEFLFSFRGSESHKIRRELFDNKEFFEKRGGKIHQIHTWYVYNEKELKEYYEGMICSKFILAPRGIAHNGSYRFYDAMAMRRVPVAIVDDWVLPDGPDWDKCSIRIPESKIMEIPAILKEYEPRWEEMGENARVVWEKYQGPGKAILHALSCIEDIIAQRETGHDERKYHREWKSSKFRRKMGWTIPQKIIRNAKSGKFVEKTKKLFTDYIGRQR